MINDNLYKRGYIISAIVALVVFIYILRLFSMQIMEDKYKDAADSNAFLKRTLYPPRGLIYDRNGELLVYNQPAYDTATTQFTVQWTWCLQTEVTPGAP